MSTNHLSVLQRLSRLAIGAVSIAAVATGAYALGPVAPAHAATTHGGCTITPSLPTADSAVSPTGETLVNYRGVLPARKDGTGPARTLGARSGSPR